MINYPNGTKRNTQHVGGRSNPGSSFGNRGMSLEADINTTNAFYLSTNQAVIHKKPTPVQIVNVNYPKRSAAVITEAYFKQPSTTDYNGLYRGKYIDFEAKETQNKTSFPLSNIHEHQITHMKGIIEHGGICFMLIRFTTQDETYFVPASDVILFWEDMLDGKRKSIPYNRIQEESYLIQFHYQKRVDYLAIIDKLYF